MLPYHCFWISSAFGRRVAMLGFPTLLPQLHPDAVHSTKRLSKKLIPGLEHAEFAITFSSPSSFALAPPLCFIKHTVKKQCGCDHACDDTEIISAQHFIESTMSWFG